MPLPFGDNIDSVKMRNFVLSVEETNRRYGTCGPEEAGVPATKYITPEESSAMTSDESHRYVALLGLASQLVMEADELAKSFRARMAKNKENIPIAHKKLLKALEEWGTSLQIMEEPHALSGEIDHLRNVLEGELGINPVE